MNELIDNFFPQPGEIVENGKVEIRNRGVILIDLKNLLDNGIEWDSLQIPLVIAVEINGRRDFLLSSGDAQTV